MGAIDFGNIQKQFREMQKKMAVVENDLKERIVEAASGGGMVKVKISGTPEVVQVEINPEVLKSGDKAMLEDLVLAAVNEGMKKAKVLRDKEMAKIASAGGLLSTLGM